MIKKFLVFSSVAIFLFACTNAKGPIPEAAQTNDCDTANWYTGKIEPIINTNCAISGCHDASSGMDMSNYTGVKFYVDKGTFKDRVLVVKNMPISPINPLTASQLNRINCWLEHGAPKTSTGATGSTGTTTTCTTTISYSSTIAPLIATKCNAVGCHNANSVYGDYTTVSGLQAIATNGELNNRVVVLKNMPKFPVNPLSATEVSNIDCWIQQGALNN